MQVRYLWGCSPSRQSTRLIIEGLEVRILPSPPQKRTVAEQSLAPDAKRRAKKLVAKSQA